MSKKQIHLELLQYAEPGPMTNINKPKFKCIGCNKPLYSILDAFTCECKGKQKSWNPKIKFP